jgi:hypothetical protein
MEHAVRLGGQQIALVGVEVVDGSFEVPSDVVTAFQTLSEGLAAACMVVSFHHDYPRGIVANTTDELEDGSGIANSLHYLFVGHTLLELRVATSVGHHSQKYSSEWQIIVFASFLLCFWFLRCYHVCGTLRLIDIFHNTPGTNLVKPATLMLMSIDVE